MLYIIFHGRKLEFGCGFCTVFLDVPEERRRRFPRKFFSIAVDSDEGRRSFSLIALPLFVKDVRDLTPSIDNVSFVEVGLREGISGKALFDSYPRSIVRDENDHAVLQFACSNHLFSRRIHGVVPRNLICWRLSHYGEFSPQIYGVELLVSSGREPCC